MRMFIVITMQTDVHENDQDFYETYAGRSSFKKAATLDASSGAHVSAAFVMSKAAHTNYA